MRSMCAPLVFVFLIAPAAAGEADNFLKICALEEDQAACESDGKDFIRWYAAALKRDYTSQRNVAYSFSQGQSAAVMKDFVQGCAWRLVVIASGSPKVDVTDQRNLEIVCGRLSAPELARAKARALAISKTIAAGVEPKPAPATKSNKPRKELDSTAEPL